MQNQTLRKSKAFSLIELSIVVLIIGILIAGVIQGSKLYYKFKLTSARAISQSSDVASIKDLVFWIDATQEGAVLNLSNSAQMEDGDRIIQWTDRNPQSSNRMLFTRLDDTSSVYPLYRSNAINGLPAVEFQGPSVNGGWLSTRTNPAIENPLGMTLFAVITVFDGNDSSEAEVGIVCKDVGNGVTNPPYLLNYSGISDKVQFYERSSSSGVDYVNTTIGSSGSTNISAIITSTFDLTVKQIAMYKNGELTATGVKTTASTEIASSGGDLNLGTQKTWATSRQFKGNIGEVIMYNRALTIEERKSVEKYLSKKWGIKLS